MCVRSHTTKEIDMRTTLIRIIMTVLTVLTVAVFTTPSAFAGDDLPSGPGVVPDSVRISGTYEVQGRTGGYFNRGVVTESGLINGTVRFETGDAPALLATIESCAGPNLFAVMKSEVMERRDDGAVMVFIWVGTWNECPHSGSNDAWTARRVWVAPGASVPVDLFTYSTNGSISASVTITNSYTRPIDTSFLERAYVDFPIRHWYNIGEYRVGISAAVTEQPHVDESPKIDTSEVDKPIVDVVDPDVPVIGTDEPDTSAAVKDETQATEQPAVKDETRATEESGGDESPKIDTSEWDTPLVTVPVPLSPLNLDPDPKGSVLIDAIDLTNVVDLADLVKPSVTIPILPSFGGSFDF